MDTSLPYLHELLPYRNLLVTPAKLSNLLYTITTNFSTIKNGTLLRQSALRYLRITLLVLKVTLLCSSSVKVVSSSLNTVFCNKPFIRRRFADEDHSRV